MINGHGDDLFRHTNIRANFSSNVYGGVDISDLKRHLKEHIDCIDSYPEPEPYALQKAIADFYTLSPDNVLVTNGATEAIYLIAQTYSGNSSGILQPTFSEYADACTIHHHQIQNLFALDEISNSVQMVWLCNPNNPTGKVWDLKVLREMIQHYPQTIFVIDQSYEYFTHKEVLEVQEAAEYNNVILIHSMTKKFAMPGLRLGYITAATPLIHLLRNERMPWSVNALAIESGMYLLAQGMPDTLDKHLLWRETERLSNEINALKHFIAPPTDTHFMLVQCKNISSAQLKSMLVHDYELLIRDASNFAGLDRSYVRIATQTPMHNDLLINALKMIDNIL
ncbi:aminotransferase class I/II-fold pyridoxal phosphate-dependent enzyme [Porphyromonas pogonae]|uniref:aminotransferase class I/II-fold pyridoxal phosphate-dependent enzyme n=1 Tax=Porphyromonas pogonae TaxID=867595 RepID=UPI002E771959|nr:aminotransferase class I/II-fold pyridoxal phosphate-dependent enzyme [Porphyromonas pogonae]